MYIYIYINIYIYIYIYIYIIYIIYIVVSFFIRKLIVFSFLVRIFFPAFGLNMETGYGNTEYIPVLSSLF